MATREEVMQAALAAHNVEHIKDSSLSHVVLLFGDGEISFTKNGVNGDLFGCRNLHLDYPPKFTDGTVYGFPYKFMGHPCIILASRDEAIKIRNMM